jgi:hypothetical protein
LVAGLKPALAVKRKNMNFSSIISTIILVIIIGFLAYRLFKGGG